MSSILCCRYPRTISPKPEEIDGIGYTQRPHISSRHISHGTEDLNTLKAIFGDTSENQTLKELHCPYQGASDCERIGQPLQVAQQENSGSFSVIKTRIRKRLSRNLALSSATTGDGIEGETSTLETGQQTKSQEELERNLQEDLLTDKGAEEGGYDIDAKFIGTPVSTDSILGHLEVTESCPVGARHSSKALPQTQISWDKSGDVQLTKAASNAYSGESRQWLVSTPIGPKNTYPLSSGKCSVLDAGTCLPVSEDEVNLSQAIDRRLDTNDFHSRHSSHRKSSPRSEQTSSGSSARKVSRMPEPPQDIDARNTCAPFAVKQGDLRSTPCLESRNSLHSSSTLKMPPSPLFLPFRTHSASNSISKNVWHLSSTGIQRHSSIPRPVTDGTDGLITEDFNPSSGFSLGPSEWLDGGEQQSALMASLTQYPQDLPLGNVSNGNCTSFTAHRRSVEGLEDATYTKSDTELKSRRDARQLGSDFSGGNEDPSLHITSSGSLANTRIPLRLGPRPLMPSVSLPQLSRFASHRRGKSNATNASTREFRALYHRHSSSSAFGSFGIPASWGCVLKDETSSLYLSRTNSFSSTTKCSVFHVPTPSDGIPRIRANTVGSGVGPGSIERDFSGHSRAGANYGKDGNSKPRRHTVGSSGVLTPRGREFESISTLASPRSSRFVEDLRFSSAENALAASGMTGYGRRQVLSARYDGPQEWSESALEEDAAAVWERALRNYDERTSGSGRRISTASRASSRHSPLRRSKVSVDLPTGSALTVPLSHEGSRRQQSQFWSDFSVAPNRKDFLEVGDFRDEPISSSGSIPVPLDRQENTHRVPQLAPEIGLSAKTGAWHRYPSHTRHMRSESADAADRVSVKDFAVAADGNKQGTSATVGREKKKSRSMTFGKGVFRMWGKQKLLRSRSMNFKRAESGHRSSIATGGYLVYPELEILPPSPLLSYQGEQGPSWTIAGDGATPSPVAAEVAEHELPPNAKTWSQLYEDCIAFPRDGDDAHPFIGDKLPVAPAERQTFPRRTHPSGAQAMMRRSTMDLKEMLELNEAKERERVLRVVEEAWGGGS